LVSTDLVEVARARLNQSCYRAEALASHHLVLRHRSAAGDGTQTAQIDAVAVGVGRGSNTVGTEDHLLIGCVRRLFVDFDESTADGLNRVSPFYLCHKGSAFAEQTASLTDRFTDGPLH